MEIARGKTTIAAASMLFDLAPSEIEASVGEELKGIIPRQENLRKINSGRIRLSM